MADPELVEPDEGQRVALFVVPNDRADATLKAISAMRDAGSNDLFMMKAEAAGGTLSGTSCHGTGTPSNDQECGDSDG